MTVPVILVDENDSAIGMMDKLEAHRKAMLHRAVSVFIFTSAGQWLIQQRAEEKYHSKSLWTNTCCTHPLPGETNIDAAQRRLQEEMGLSCELQEVFWFIYRETLDNELAEHELDHVFVGISDDFPLINTNEVMEYRYTTTDELSADIAANPSKYTVWFRLILDRYKDVLLKHGDHRNQNSGK